MSMLTKVLFVTLLPMSTAMAQTQTINFDNFKTGDPPPGWTATLTGSGQAKWTVEKDDTAPSKPNVLKQSGEATYPVCLKDDSNLKDGFDNHFTVTFDGKKAIEWDDDTFKDAGKIGVWTKADSVAEFDDFAYGGK